MNFQSAFTENPFVCQLEFAQPAKLDLNKKSFRKQKTIQNFTIDA